MRIRSYRGIAYGVSANPVDPTKITDEWGLDLTPPPDSGVVIPITGARYVTPPKPPVNFLAYAIAAVGFVLLFRGPKRKGAVYNPA
jgi:hypothetical protein